jgi:hypothetical protein
VRRLEEEERRSRKKARAKAYRLRNLEKCRAYRRAYYLKNKDREIELSRKWSQANPDKRRVYDKTNYQRNDGAAKVRNWRRNNKARAYAAERRWALKHPEAMRAKWKRASKKKDPAKDRVLRARYRDTITDGWVAKILEVPLRLLPPALIEAKRAQLRIARTLHTSGVRP